MSHFRMSSSILYNQDPVQPAYPSAKLQRMSTIALPRSLLESSEDDGLHGQPMLDKHGW